MTTATPGRFVHPALFYRNVDEYLGVVLPFLRAGLDVGMPVAVAVPGPNLELLRHALGPRAADVLMVDMTEEGRNPGRIIPSVLLAFAQTHAPGPVRIIGEPIWPGRTATEYPACVLHEALINLAFAGSDAAILCPYDVSRLDEQAVADAHRTHPMLIDSDGEQASTRYAPQEVIATYNLPLATPDRRSTARFLFNRGNLSQTRAYAVAHAKRLGLTGTRVDDLELAVAELAANSVVHGGGRGTLAMWAADGYIVCEVRDAGTITDPLAGRRPVTADALGGRGLLLVNQLADLVRSHTTTDRTAFRLHFLQPA